MKKRVLALLLALVMALGLLPGAALAADSDFTIENGVLTWYRGSGGDVVIPNGVTSIGRRAFATNGKVTSVTIPSGVTSIGESAFDNCHALVNISIPNTVTSIGNKAFVHCTSLSNVTIPDGVTEVGTQTFYGCTNLTSVSIPDSVTSIGDHAFDNCRNLISITIPKSVTYIGEGAFWECWGLTDVDILGGITRISKSMFWDCRNLTSVIIPSGVTSIEDYAFNNCTKLKNIIIPNSVTSIGISAFQRCSSLTNVVIPSRVSKIGDYAFIHCSSLSTVTVPGNIQFGWDVFGSCSSLKDIYYGGTEVQWEDVTKDTLVPEPWPAPTIHYNSNGTAPVEVPDGNFRELHQLKSWDTFTNTVFFHDGANYQLSNDNDTVDMNSLLNQWVICSLTRSAGEVRLTALHKLVPEVAADLELDSRAIEYRNGKLRFEDGEFESKHSFEIPFKVTIMNKASVNGLSQQDLAKADSLAITVDSVDIRPPVGFNLGWFGGGKIVLDHPVTIKVGETWTSPEGYLRAETSFKPKASDNEYNVQATIKTDRGKFIEDQTFFIKNLEIQNDKTISELASEAANELQQIDPNVFAITALQLIDELGLKGNKLDMFKREIIAQIVMSNAPEKTFQQTVEKKLLEEVFNYKPKLGVDTYDLPLTYTIKTPKYGKVVLELTCRIQNYSLDSTTFGSVVNINYQILSTKKKIPTNISTSGKLGAINRVNVKAFSDAAYSLAEAELKEAYNKAWGNSADEVATLIFGDTVTAILKKCNTSCKDITWKIITAPSTSTSVRCPVDVFVYDESGELCGSIEGNKITKSSDAFELLVVDDDKYILGLEDGYMVKYVATDNGTMSVEVVEYYGYDCPIEVIKFNDVPLTKNKGYSQNIPETILADDGAYDLTSDSGQTIRPDETQDLLGYEIEDIPTTLPTVESIPATGTAYARTQTVKLDGRNVEFQCYALKNAQGNETNYVKLRDLAIALNGTKAQFNAGWDQTSKTISIIPGAAYEAVGGEGATPFSGDQPYRALSDTPVRFNGSAVRLTSFSITYQGGGYTYYKLRDLGQLLGFNVKWDGTSVVIETDKPYTGK